MQLLKRFWANINFRKWTFGGRKLSNPLLVIWRILWIVPIYIVLAFAGLVLWVSWTHPGYTYMEIMDKLFYL